MAYAAAAQNAVERGVKEAAVARFRQHDIAFLRRQLVHQLIIPAAFRQQLALQLRTLTHRFQRVGFVIVRRARAAGFNILVIPAILEPDNQHTRGASGGDGGINIVDNRPGSGDVKAGEIQITAPLA